MFQPIPILCLLLLSIATGCTTPTSPPKSETTPTPSVSQAILEPGYKTIAGEGVTLALPKNYEGGNPSTDLKAIAQKLQALDSNYEKRLDTIKQNPAAVALLAFDSGSANGYLTSVNIVSEKIPKGVTLQQYTQAATQSLSGQFKVMEQAIAPLEGNQAGRIVAEATNAPLKHLYYIIPGEDKFWLVTYSTSTKEFDQRLPDFEKSVRSFALQPKKAG